MDRILGYASRVTNAVAPSPLTCAGRGRDGAEARVGKTTASRQRRSDLNVPIFLGFVNGAALRRMCETKRITASTLYDKLDFFHRQCLAFAGAQERRIPQLEMEASSC